MQICAIIINYRDMSKSARCVRSLVHQGIDTLYLVDNSASATEAESVIAFSEDLKAERAFPNVHAIVNEDNLGFGRAINLAIQRDLNQNGHDYYLLINNDAVAPDNMVERLLAELQRDRWLFMVSPAIVTSDQIITYFWYNILLGHITTTRQRHSLPYISGCCLLMKRDVICHGALFDEDFFMYGEDVQLCKRLRDEKKGYKCIENVFILHEGSGSSKMGSLFYEYHVARGHVILSSKLCRGAQTALCYLGRFFYLSSRGVKRAVKFRSSVPLVALLLCWLPPSHVTIHKVVDNG